MKQFTKEFEENMKAKAVRFHFFRWIKEQLSYMVAIAQKV